MIICKEYAIECEVRIRIILRIGRLASTLDVFIIYIMFGGGLQDEMLRAFIDKIFDKYDADKNGTLDDN